MCMATLPKSCVGFYTKVPKSDHMVPISNIEGFAKPNGGLWTTPKGALTWEEWCVDNMYAPAETKKGWHWDISPDAHLLIIDTLLDLQKAVAKFGIPTSLVGPVLDYKKLANLKGEEKLDGIWLTDNGQWETRLPKRAGDPNLYGWDLDTILWFNMKHLLNQREYQTPAPARVIRTKGQLVKNTAWGR